MLATPISAQAKNKNGPRPIRLSRDIQPVLELLDDAFGPILDSNGRPVLGPGITLHQKAPLILRLNRLTRGLVPAFVWEENGTVVGNVSLIDTQQPERFLIANVAVHSSYRRRGIARGLMEAALEHIQAHGGREIMLQVVQSNEAAITLYHSMGFETLGSITRWENKAVRLRRLPLEGPQPEVRPLAGGSWREAYTLDRQAFPPDLEWPLPRKSDYYKGGLWRRLVGFINGHRVEHWEIRSRRGQLMGLGSIESNPGRLQQFRIRVIPEWQSQLERPLLAKLLRRARGNSHRQTIEMVHLADDKIMKALLLEANFKPIRTLDVMRLLTAG